MASSAHATALSAKHVQLEAMIFQETQRPHPDDTLVMRLKKQKLRVKEHIESLR